MTFEAQNTTIFLAAIKNMQKQLDWRGPTGKPQGHIVVTREEAKSLLLEIDRILDRSEKLASRVVELTKPMRSNLGPGET